MELLKKIPTEWIIEQCGQSLEDHKWYCIMLNIKEKYDTGKSIFVVSEDKDTFEDAVLSCVNDIQEEVFLIEQ